MLVSDGKLGWDDQVIEHLPQFHLNDAAATGMMNVRDLMGHKDIETTLLYMHTRPAKGPSGS